MGVDTNIFVRKDQVETLLDNFSDDFVFLVSKTLIRWNDFLYEMPESLQEDSMITSKELLLEIARTNKFENREEWVNICSKYDLVFQADTLKAPNGEYVELFDLYSEIKKEVLKKYKKFINDVKNKKIYE